MSAQRINRFEWFKVLLQTEGLSATAKNVAGALATEFCNHETGQLNPSIDTLAEYLKVHRDTIKRAFKELRNGGWMVRAGNGGRSVVPQITLTTPGKIVPFRAAVSNRGTRRDCSDGAAKRGQDCNRQTADKRGAGVHPQPDKGGANLHLKGGQTCTPLYKEEQYKEQKARVLALWGRHRFTGNPFHGPAVLPLENWQALNPWAEWVHEHHLPSLAEMPILGSASAFLLPYRTPPSEPEKIEEALAYFHSMIDAEGASYAAH